MTDLVVVEQLQILAEQPDELVLHEVVEEVDVLAVCEQGPPGIPGPTGTPGAGLQILGALNSPAELPTPAGTGDAYLIGGDLWVYANSAWTNAGPVQGPPGERGKDGQIRFTGHGAPPTVIVGSEPGDTYLDLDTGDIYKLI